VSIILFQFFLGFAFLFLGATVSLGAANRLAIHLGIPKVIIAVIFMAFGTSLPEGMVSVMAALQNSSEIALGNVMGSNIANTILVLGVASVIRPVVLEKKVIFAELLFTLLATLSLALFLWNGELSKIEAGIFLGFFLIYGYSLFNRKKVPEDFHLNEEEKKAKRVLPQLILIVLGIIALIYGARSFVEGAVALGRHFEVPEWVIGITVVAIGTSLPELAATVIASIKNESDFIVGNVLGSNILNVFLVLGLAGMFCPLRFVNGAYLEQIICFLTLTLIPTGLFFFQGKITRTFGVLMLASYGVYLYFIQQSI